eukprot:3980421-Pyramimonas_sp.AAC.1
MDAVSILDVICEPRAVDLRVVASSAAADIHGPLARAGLSGQIQWVSRRIPRVLFTCRNGWAAGRIRRFSDLVACPIVLEVGSARWRWRSWSRLRQVIWFVGPPKISLAVWWPSGAFILTNCRPSVPNESNNFSCSGGNRDAKSSTRSTRESFNLIL